MGEPRFHFIRQLTEGGLIPFRHKERVVTEAVHPRKRLQKMPLAFAAQRPHLPGWQGEGKHTNEARCACLLPLYAGKRAQQFGIIGRRIAMLNTTKTAEPDRV